MTTEEAVVICARRRNTGWVCEAHNDRPWEGPHACGCGAPGVSCPNCNSSDKDHPPRLPAGFVPDDNGPDNK
jgi:hypothetical protein